MFFRALRRDRDLWLYPEEVHLNKRLETKSSRTAEWTCICRAASFLESDPCLKSDDSLALRILPSPIKSLIQIPLYRTLHCRFGAPKGIYEYIIGRTKYIDAAFRKAVEDRFDAIVILGAGFDTRAIRFPSGQEGPSVYEFDSSTTQQRKRELFSKGGVVLPPNVRLLEIDLDRESLSEKLQAVDFPTRGRGLFVMEGVTMYLDPLTIESTFHAASRYMGDDGLVVFDYVRSPVLRGESKSRGESEVIKAVSRVNESWRFGLDEHSIEQFLSGFGLRLRDHLTPRDIEDRFFRNTEGTVTGQVNEAHCLVTAIKAG